MPNTQCDLCLKMADCRLTTACGIDTAICEECDEEEMERGRK